MASANKKNGLLELFRFLFSVWVAYYHGFFPILSDKFSGVNISVDFFFLLTGLFFLKSVEKYREKPYFKSVSSILWGRSKRLIIPLAIAALSVLLCNIIFPMDFGFNWPLSFLWFFAAQYLLLALYFLLYKKIKSRLAFNIVMVVIILISMSTFRLLEVRNFDIPLRTPAMLALGILLSQIPKLQIKAKKPSTAKKCTVLVNALGFAASTALLIYLAYLPKFEVWRLHLMCLIICPAVIYFASSLPVHGKFFNLLGELSLYLYLAQCPIILHHYGVSRDTRDQFPLYCVCIVAMFLINRIALTLINKKKTKKA